MISRGYTYTSLANFVGYKVLVTKCLMGFRPVGHFLFQQS